MKTTEFVKALFSYYQQDTSTESGKVRMKYIGMWIEENIPLENRANLLKKILDEFVPTSTNPMPLIPHFKELMGLPSVKDEIAANANEIVNRIWGAICKYGQSWENKAKEYIGEIGWDFVQKQGGWTSLVFSTNDESEGILKAQWRESLKGIQYRHNQGKTEPPSFQTNPVKNVIENINKALPKMED